MSFKTKELGRKELVGSDNWGLEVEQMGPACFKRWKKNRKEVKGPV